LRRSNFATDARVKAGTAVGPADVRLIQVKAGGAYFSAVEREAIRALSVPPAVSREAWRFPDRIKVPLIERL
jgi:hypothetical protein